MLVAFHMFYPRPVKEVHKTRKNVEYGGVEAGLYE